MANQKQELPVVAMFVNGSGQNEQTFYQVSVHLAKGFHQRRLKCEKLTDDRAHQTVFYNFQRNMKLREGPSW
jgi:hypothetical protein